MKRTFIIIFVATFCICSIAWGNTVQPVIEMDRTHIPTNEESIIYTLVSFEIPELPEDPTKPRPNLNLALVIDRSGSMRSSGKLEYAQKAASILVDSLKPTDRLAVVEYDDKISVLWPSSPVESPAMIKRRINALTPGGSTNLTGGMLRGAEEVLRYLDDKAVNRVLLLSDGLANKGVTNKMEISELVNEKLEKGVQISTMGLGQDYDEDLMQMIAEQGAGQYYFIEGPTQMGRIFQEEMSILFATVAKDVTMRLEMGPKIKEAEVYGFPVTRENSVINIQQQDFYSGEKRNLLVRFEVKPSKEGKIDLGTLKFSYLETDSNNRQTISYDLSISATSDIQLVMDSVNQEVEVEALLIKTDQKHEEYMRMYEQGKRKDSLDGISLLQAELTARNTELKNVSISKKIEALAMEEQEMAEADRSKSAKAVYLKKSKQRLYQAQKGRRGKYLLMEGAKGMEVENLQIALRREGFYHGQKDGRFSSELVDAVKAFQRSRNLTPDGFVGPATLKGLGLY